MLLDKKLIMFDDSSDQLPASTNPLDWIDLANMGYETMSDLAVFILFKTEFDTHTALSFTVQTSPNADFSGASAVPQGNTSLQTDNYLPTSAAIPAGSLVTLPLPVNTVFRGGAPSGLDRYLGVVVGHAGTAGAADEELLVWVGSMKNMPYAYGEVS